MMGSFINRPLFACVLSAFIVIDGLVAARALPIALYPDILPPMVEVATTYHGATSDVSDQTVAAPLEQQVNGADGILYLRSTTAPNGNVNLVAIFTNGYDPAQAALTQSA